MLGRTIVAPFVGARGLFCAGLAFAVSVFAPWLSMESFQGW
jgi:hypothetical protein